MGQFRAWHGETPSWHSRLRDAGHTVTSIGKLHFRSTDDDNGFTEEILPLHVLDGKGDLIAAPSASRRQSAAHAGVPQERRRGVNPPITTTTGT